MTLEQFAKQAGCIVSMNEDPRGWGGVSTSGTQLTIRTASLLAIRPSTPHTKAGWRARLGRQQPKLFSNC